MHPNQKAALDDAVRAIVQNPAIGEMKKGDLAGLQVYKYKLDAAQYLLGYHYDAAAQSITLVAIGPHENFYRDAKR